MNLTARLALEPIHQSAWNKNYANFAFWGFSEVRLSGSAKYTPIDSLRVFSDLAAIVAFSGLGDCPNNLILSFPSPDKVAVIGTQHIPQTNDFCGY
jgi:hypothetical protein